MATPLSGALASLQNSTNLLASSISILDAGVSDFPRLSKVLSQTRHFELMPASTLVAAQQDLLSELTPEVEELLSRVERQIERMERREESLRAKWSLQEGRLGRETSSASGAQMTKAHAKSSKSRQSAAMENVRVKQLKQKKERLSYAVERLQMQAQQAERKLRQSMAAQEQQTTTNTDDIDDLFD